MVAGSGQFSSQKAQKPHLLQGQGGIASEVADLRADIKKDFLANAAIAVEEFTNVPVADVDAFSLASASVNGIRTVALGGVVGTGTLDPPRNVTVTVGGGGTPADAAANATITGVDINGNAISEVLALNQAGGLTVGAKAFARVTSIVEDAGQGAGATISYGFGAIIGLAKPIKTRAGRTGPIQEIAAGAVVTNGVFTTTAVGVPNGTYAPNSAPNDTNDYALYYEYDAALNKDA
jgi:hypothetical protein